MRLPFPPSTNTYYRSIIVMGRVRILLSRKAQDYRAAVAMAVGAPVEHLGRLRMDVLLSAPTKRLYDLDNRLKAIQDALQHAGVFRDDEQIDEITVTRMPHGGGYAEVTLTEIEP